MELILRKKARSKKFLRKNVTDYMILSVLFNLVRQKHSIPEF